MVNFKAFSRVALSGSLVLTVGFAFGQQGKNFVGPIDQHKTQKASRKVKMTPRPYTVLVAFNYGKAANPVGVIERELGLYEDTTIASPYFKRFFISQDAQLKGMTTERAIKALKQMPFVRIAEYDMPVSPDQVNDPQYSTQWGLNNTGQTGGTVDADVDAPEAWPLIPSVTPITLAILDDGIEVNHSDLAANIVTNPLEVVDGIDNDGNGFIDDVKGWDFADGDNDASPPTASSSHGTHVAGIAAAVSNNATGVASASRNVKILPVRFYRGQSTWISDLILACDFARIRGAKVVNISYNLDGWTQLLADAFIRLNTADSVVMLSAGNNGQANPPRLAMLAQTSNLCFVASTDHNDNLSSFSNYGAQVQVAAPGESIVSTVPFGGYANFSGTSMASPFAAGIMGTIRAMYPSMTAAQSISRLGLTSDRKAQLTGKVAFGRVNLASAIQNDTVAPAPVTGLTVLRRSSGTFLFQFNASGDDASVGGASFYDVRTSIAPINAGNFNAASPNNFATNLPLAGNPVKTSIGSITPGGSYYVAVKAIDDVGNESSVVSAGPFSLLPPLAIDNMEGSAGFTGTGTWAITSAVSNSPTKSWTDSPAGNYADNANTALTYSSSINVTGPMVASFMMRYDLESGFDFLTVEASTNAGATWSPLDSVTGQSGPVFQAFSIPLTSFVGQTVQLRFRLTSDSSVTGDGVYIDDFTLESLATTFLDNVEGALNFNATGSTWVVSTESASSPTRAWNDSPGANYLDNTNQWLKGTVNLDAEAVGSPLVTFKGLINTEDGFDFLNVHTSSDGGVNWTPRAAFSGLFTSFNSYSVPMGVLGTVRIGFQLTSDGSVVGSGASIDDISVVGEPWVQQINGTVGLNGFAGTKPFNIKLRSGVTVLQTTGVSMTGLTGTFQINSNLFGPHDVMIEGASFLRRVVPAVNVTAFTTVSTNLINGDINGDNVIGTADFNLLRTAFGSNSSSANWNPNADLNGDGVVGTADFNILRTNFGQIGDN
ncbi:MAG: S8 family serine peptidase [Armatimonadota bacterium]